MLKNKLQVQFLTLISCILGLLAFMQNSQKATVVVNTYLGKETISRHIYGHFPEHPGKCIYGGYRVGEDSEIEK